MGTGRLLSGEGMTNSHTLQVGLTFREINLKLLKLQRVLTFLALRAVLEVVAAVASRMHTWLEYACGFVNT